MRIIQLIFSLSSGGAERFVVDLSNELTRHGHEVHLVVFRNELKSNHDAHFYRTILDEKVNYHNLKIKEGFRFSAFTKTISKIKEIKPDIVHCHLNIISFILPLVLFDKKTKFYQTLHNVADKTIDVSFEKPINRYFYRTNKIIPIAISEICNNTYRKFYRLNNAYTIVNGRSVVTATSDLDLVKQEVKSYMVTPNTPVFIHVARFYEAKNQQLLVDTFNKVAGEGTDFILLVIGSGFDKPEGKKLQERACNKIIFLGEKRNVNDYLLCSDAFCLSSYYEGLPISLLEALSAGCVPVCTPVGGIPDVVTEGVTGYLSEEVSLESYYKAIKRYIDNPGSINKQFLQDYYINNYSIEKTADEHIELYIRTGKTQ
jgi:glycosyltransferase involved in cell wall biosynthesis